MAALTDSPSVAPDANRRDDGDGDDEPLRRLLAGLEAAAGVAHDPGNACPGLQSAGLSQLQA